MLARDMDLQYAEDGETLQRAVLTGEAQVVVAKGAQGGGRYALVAAILVSSGTSQLDVARPFIYFQF